jgi:hypothetical protein
MATDIVQSLFGITPDMYQQSQQARADQQAMQYARLSPFEQANFAIGRGANMLGGAVGRGLGGEDPELARITARQQIAQQINYADPKSIAQGVQLLSQAGDTQGAMYLADVGRKAESEMALAQQRQRERAAADPFQKLIESGKYTPASLAEYQRTGLPTDLVLYEKPEKPEKPVRTSYGPEADRASKARFGRNFDELTQAEAAVIDTLLEERGVKKAKESSSKLVLPGEKALGDIPSFRNKVQDTIKPQIQAVDAADNALTNIQNSIDTGNFASFRAAQTQFARAISGSGDLSQKELLAAGADPSLLGGTADYLARLFTSTPTVDTQNKIKSTLQAIKKVSTDKANAEINVQREIAYSTPGYDRAKVDRALTFPQFSAQQTPAISNDLASQAARLLAERQKAKK